jgi:hypothetical protein
MLVDLVVFILSVNAVASGGLKLNIVSAATLEVVIANRPNTMQMATNLMDRI